MRKCNENRRILRESVTKLSITFTKSIKRRLLTVNAQHLTNSKTGLHTILSHFEGVKYSTAKDSEYNNLDLFMSRLERFTHKLMPKWPMEPTLYKIEKLGKTGLGQGCFLIVLSSK